MLRDMKKVGFLIALLALTSRLFCESPTQIDELLARADAAMAKRDFASAAGFASKAAAAEKQAKQPRPETLVKAAMILGQAGHGLRDFDAARRAWNEGLAVSGRVPFDLKLALLIFAGDFFRDTNDQTAALRLYGEAADLCRANKQSQYDIVIQARLAESHRMSGDFKKALEINEKLLAEANKTGDPHTASSILNNIGLVLTDRGDYAQAVSTLREALRVARRYKAPQIFALADNLVKALFLKGDTEEAVRAAAEAVGNGDLGLTLGEYLDFRAADFQSKGNLETSYKVYGQALAQARKSGRTEEAASAAQGLASLAYRLGRYDEAKAGAEEAVELYRKAGMPDETSVPLSLLGLVHKHWGLHEKAVDYYEKALAIDRRTGDPRKISVRLANIGAVHVALGDFMKARSYLEESETWIRKTGNRADLAQVLNNLAAAYDGLGLSRLAYDTLTKVVELERAAGEFSKLGTRYNNLAAAALGMGRTDEALGWFREAIAEHRRTGAQDPLANALDNLGDALSDLGRYAEASGEYRASIEIRERLRRTAKGSARRDYLALVARTYSSLAVSLLRTGNFDEAFRIMEMSKARLLAEQIAGDENFLSIPSLRQVREGLDAKTVVLVYAGIDSGTAALLVVNRGGARAEIVPIRRLASEMLETAGPKAAEWTSAKRGLRIAPQGVPEDEPPSKTRNAQGFKTAVDYYRRLLSSPSGQSRKERETIARLLYDHLVKPAAKELAGAREILVVPDGLLSVLPFETFIEESGRYLVEKFDVRYTQSLSVQKLVAGRRYEGGRTSLLAIGGAPYSGGASVAGKETAAEPDAGLLRDRAATALAEGKSLRPLYESMGITGWQDLPGTLVEVKKIAPLFAGSKLITGREASERRIKAMSASGELAGYRYVHLGAHGLAVPEVPELSALVLSQERDGADDGYLTMQEIAGLKFRADYVTLSACETGLGRIYSGEGVAGLCQAFLTGGANGLGVSLWQVADESTAEFMAGLYASIARGKAGPAASLADMKRAFIRGDYGKSFTDPFFWAPFIHYGLP